VPVEPSVHVLLELPDRVVTAVRAIAEASELADGTPPLGEETLLRLRHAGPHRLHLLAGADPFNPGGYAFLQLAPAGAEAGPAELELVVDPEHRGQRVGTALLERALVEAEHSGLLAWAHGTLPGARRLADAHDMRVARELLRLGADISAATPAELPDGFSLRTFRAGDEQELLAVNAAAFAHHPEQGALSVDGLAARMAEPWFDADGLLLAWRTEADGSEGRLAGFHWTKIDVPAPATVGEVYVLGVHPEEGGQGLGRSLLAAGLAALAARGVGHVYLYVEADNAVARRIYERAGFTLESIDTRYWAPPSTNAASPTTHTAVS
jgi:mycothiol synthase